VDFTSALYLGFTHGSGSLRWDQLTTGVPAALRRPSQAAEPELGFAALVGCERAVAQTSTLHAAWDLFGESCPRGVAVLYDDAAYPVLRWGLERASHRRLPVIGFRHHDPEALERALAGLPSGTRPWIVTDGFCPGCAQIAPLREYSGLAAARGGRVIVDDTQALGLLGSDPARGRPFGAGGGGSLRRLALADPAIVVLASLAKAFGVPLAMVAGSAAFIDPFAGRSETLVHCSPPSIAHLAAASAALRHNAAEGESLRAQLAARVRGFRRAMRASGVKMSGALFPLQRLPVAGAREALRVQKALAAHGVQAVVERVRCRPLVAVTFVITVRHDEGQLRRAAAILAAVLRNFPAVHAQTPSSLEV
jgi:8-amino-7-oxononanoate synthase